MTTMCITDPLPNSQPSSSTLVTEATTTQFESTATYGAVLRASCRVEAEHAQAAYKVLDEDCHRSRAWDLEHCRGTAWFVRHDETGEVRVASNSCRLRWCPLCAQARRNFIAGEVKNWLDRSDHPKFLTLTVRHTDEPLAVQITRLYAYFRELRRRRDFERRISGGIWFFHIKRAKTSGQWHPHLHCLVTGLYIPRSRVRHMWIEITNGSEHVHIRGVDDNYHAAFEAARYSASPGSLVNMDLAGCVEMIDTLHGRRICGTWGTGRKISLRPEPQHDAYLWMNIGSWQAVTACAKHDRRAQAILLAWRTKQCLSEGIVFNPVDDYVGWTAGMLYGDFLLETAEEVERSPP